MSPQNFFSSPQTKLKSFKKDLAPIGFFLDIFATEIFKIPVMPIPMRIDKLINGDPTLFILPDANKLDQLFEKLGFIINFESFFSVGIKNLINFAKKKYKEITLRTLERESIINWFVKSKMLSAEIPSLTESFSFIISEFLKMYSNIVKKGLAPKNEDYGADLIQYCEKIINYFQERIEQNIFQIKNKGLIKTVQLYKEKKNNYYPEIFSIDVYNLNKNEIKQMNFVPYLIYDDIFDSFSYNKMLLNEGSQKILDINSWKNNGIINKILKTNKINYQYHKKFELLDINLEKIL